MSTFHPEVGRATKPSGKCSRHEGVTDNGLCPICMELRIMKLETEKDTKLIALVERAHQIGEAEWDRWIEAFDISQGETVRHLADRIRARGNYPNISFRVINVFEGDV